MTETLQVFFEQHLVGTLHPLAGGRVAFEYGRTWLDDRRSFPISASLPLAPGINPELSAQAFFAVLYVSATWHSMYANANTAGPRRGLPRQCFSRTTNRR